MLRESSPLFRSRPRQIRPVMSASPSGPLFKGNSLVTRFTTGWSNRSRRFALHGLALGQLSSWTTCHLIVAWKPKSKLHCETGHLSLGFVFFLTPFFRNARGALLAWNPPNSPDLNIIEKLWDVIVAGIHRRTLELSVGRWGPIRPANTADLEIVARAARLSRKSFSHCGFPQFDQ